MTADNSRPTAGLFTVRLTIDGVRHQVASMLADREGTIKASIEHEMNVAVASFDFAREVKRATEACLEEMIREAVRRALHECMDGSKVDRMVRGEAAKILMEGN